MSTTDVIVGLVGLVLVFAVLWVSAGIVGRVADEFGEERARWQAMMLPFGFFGPVVARTILSRRNGGRGGGFA